MPTDAPNRTSVSLRDALSATPARRAMQLGFFECAADARLGAVARMLADHHIHCLVVPDLQPAGGRKSWGVVSDRAVLRMLHDGAAHVTAGDMAHDDPVGVAPGDSLLHVATLMCEHDVAHVVVISPTTGRPAGIVSSLDLARVVGELANG
jgi:CBS domain-containing protein